jgi:hypothetical protein
MSTGQQDLSAKLCRLLTTAAVADVHWARAVKQTRAANCDWADCVVLQPIYDLLNHANDRNCAVHHSSQG